MKAEYKIAPQRAGRHFYLNEPVWPLNHTGVFRRR
jgi:hypothetical protein